MNLTIDNYEAWLLDKLEGRLSSAQDEVLSNFIQQHPELADWQESLEQFVIQPSAETMPQRHLLYRTEIDLMGIPSEEYWQIKQLEEGLGETACVADAISGLGTSANTSYQKIKLIPGPVSYPHKQQLKRPRFLFLAPTVYRIAAGFAILVSIGLFWFNRTATLPGTVELAEILEPKPSVATPAQIQFPVENRITPRAAHREPVTTPASMQREPVAVVPKHRVQNPPMEKIATTKTEIVLATPAPNAFEVGLTHMMPTYVALMQQSDRTIKPVTRNKELNWVDAGVKIYSLMSGREMRFNRETDDSGEITAYNLQSQSVTVSRQVRR